ncbi:hypothetical protein [Paenibacillus sp. DMB20]|uniref:hypothetical protein n=1 Tax=Paenibacillus sp. DMB20 TaxID=1642570 RepID=UPI0006276DA5|nr:hypothetical protein [Paenibacillus sp. DMB20]KKO51118.1 hypothetical protein XI25_29470 [Paenibacillus sp. DMB20]
MKAKITITLECEYEIRSEYYKGITEVPDNDQDRLEYDILMAKEDHWMFLENGDWKLKEVTGQLLEDDNQ